MAFRIRDIIDAGLNAITNVVEETLTSDPGTSTLGRFYFRSDTKRRSYYDGSAVQRVANISDSLSTFAVPTGDVAWGSYKITSLLDPTNPQDACTKNYADAIGSGHSPRDSVKYAAAAALPAYTYANGTAGVGATITANANAVWTIDGQSLTIGDRVLLPSAYAAAGSDAGIYTVTTVGTGSVATVLTRATDFNSATNIVPGAYTFIESGTALKATGWIMTQTAAITVGTTALTWTQDSAATVYSAGDGIEIVGTAIKDVSAYRRNVAAVQTTNMASLSAPGATIDGVTPSSGVSRILLTGQSTGSQNGVWIWNGASSAMTRPTDYASADVAQAAFDTEVWADSGGTTYAGTGWRITTTGAITIDTTATVWAQVAVNVAANGVTGALPVANGGTGATSAAAGLAALGGTTKYAANMGNASATSFVLTHSLGTLDVVMNVIEVATGNAVNCGMQATSTNTATFTFSVAPTSNQFRAVIIG
jgi:hypothetical protein